MPLASTTEAVELRLRPTARIFFPPISTAPRLEIADPRVQTQYNPAPQQDSVVGVAFRALQLVECRHAPGSLGLTGEQLSCGAGRQPRASPDQTSPRRRCPTMVHRRSPVADKSSIIAGSSRTHRTSTARRVKRSLVSESATPPRRHAVRFGRKLNAALRKGGAACAQILHLGVRRHERRTLRWRGRDSNPRSPRKRDNASQGLYS